jgi:1-acyl-sn-glycerol-3-phosphate acyltransferase
METKSRPTTDLDKSTAAFAERYPAFYELATKEPGTFGFDVQRVAEAEPVLRFLFEKWWRVNFTGLDRLPETGSTLIVSNSGGVLPWHGLMLAYALFTNKDKPRRLNILADLDWINDERLYYFLCELGFVPWSATNAKKLFAAGETVLIFPEGITGFTKPFSDRHRLREFDWTKFLPAVEEGLPIVPLATLGCDEAVPVLANLKGLARFLDLPAFPITPFFPWLPAPMNLLSLPVHWSMSLMKPTAYKVQGNREEVENVARQQAKFNEGEIQSELNRLMRVRIKPLF